MFCGGRNYLTLVSSDKVHVTKRISYFLYCVMFHPVFIMFTHSLGLQVGQRISQLLHCNIFD